MRRAVKYDLEPGKELRLCSAEDLIIHKAVAGRPRDIDYIRSWLDEFSSILEKPELSEYFEEPWRQIAK